MGSKSTNSPLDLLYWADIHPNKRGSIEDYICYLAQAANQAGITMKFILGSDICDEMRQRFTDFRVDYTPFPRQISGSPWGRTRFIKNYRPRAVNYSFLGSHPRDVLYSPLAGNPRIIITDRSSSFGQAPTCVGPKRILARALRNLTNQRVSRFIGVSEFVARRLVERAGAPPGKVRAILNGVDLDRYRPLEDEEARQARRRRLLDLGPEKVVICFVGQLAPYKGLPELLEAAASLCPAHPELCFLIFGDGPMRGQVEELAGGMGPDSFRYMGHRSDVEEYYKVSDISLVPSVWEEAFGLVNVEAMACGAVVVASRIGGIPEIVVHEKTGLLVEPQNSGQLQDAIVRLASNPSLREDYARNALKRCQEHFSIHRMVSQTIQVYEEALGL
jgi:glycosyltransferase involved in cell wall biosynthesis